MAVAPKPETQLLLALIDAVKNSPVTPMNNSSPVSNLDMGHAILQNAKLDWSNSGTGALPGQAKNKSHRSVLGRIFDVLSRPNYAVAESVSEALKHGSIFEPGAAQDIAHGAISGLAGTQKTTFSDVLEQQGVKNPWVKGIGGLALDIGADPTTYIGAGFLKNLAKKAGSKVGVKVGEAGYAGTRAVEQATPTLTLAAEKARKPARLVTGPKGITAEETGQYAFTPASRILDRIVDNPVAVREVIPKPRSYAALSDAAEISRAQKIGAEYVRKLKIKDNFITPRQQVLLYRNLLRKTGNDAPKAAAMLNETERFMTAQGIGFKLWDGSRGSLSHAIDEVGGPKKFSDDMLKQWETGKVTDNSLRQGVENIIARSAMSDSPKVREIIDQVFREHKMADNTLNAPTASVAKKTSAKTAVKQAQVERLISPAGVKTMESILDEMDRLGKGRIELTLGKKKKILERVVGSGDTRTWKELQASQILAHEQTLGYSLKGLGEKVWGNRPFDNLLMSLSTWYRNTMLRPFAQASELSARASASARIHALNAKIGTKTQQEIDNAWRGAQGYLPETDELGKFFDDSMNDLFGTSGLAEDVASVADRSGLTLSDINNQLRMMDRRWPGADRVKFVQGQVDDPITGTVRDYTGAKWKDSWKSWQVTKPQEAMYRVQTAVEAVAKEYAMVDDLVARWGSKVPTGDFKYAITDSKHGLWRARGYYFPEEVAKQIPVMFKQLDGLYSKKSEMAKFLDEVLSAWKRGVTIYVPSHHVRNLIGDAWMAWFDGVTDPRWYKRAASVLKTQRKNYQGAHVSELVGAGAVERATGKGRVLFHTKNGIPVTDQMVYVAAHQNGLLLSSRDIEDLFGAKGDILGDAMTKWKPLGGHAYNAASHTAELREHYAILAHFMNRISRSKETRLEDIYKDAAWYVRKYHPNGTDISQFERNTLRRIVPFYSWTRKAIPLIIEQILFNPRKVLVLPKTMQAAQTSLGIEGTTRDDPFPVDQAFPNWMREQNIGPLGLSGAGGLLGLIGGLGRQAPQTGTFGEEKPFPAYTTVGQNLNPLYSIFGQFTPNPVQGALEMSNPALQMMLELGTNQKIPGKAPIVGESGDFARYAIEQVPIASPIYRILNRPGASTGKDYGRPINVEALLNTLLAAGITGTGPFVPSRQRRQGALPKEFKQVDWTKGVTGG